MSQWPKNFQLLKYAIFPRLAFLAFVAGIPIAANARDMMPLSVIDLNDRRIDLPTGLPNGRTMILLAFKHDDQPVLQRWKQILKLSPETPGWIEIPAIGVSIGFVQSMIKSRMKSKNPGASARSHIAPAFGDSTRIASAFGVGGDRIELLVVDHAGHILAGQSGSPDAAKVDQLKSVWHTETRH